MAELSQPSRAAVRRAGPRRVIGALVLAAGAVFGSFALFAGSASATGDTLSGSAFGASIEGSLPILPPTPSVTLPASGTAQSTTVAVPLNPVLTDATLTASTGSTNNTTPTEQVTSEGRVENANILISGSTVVLAATALDSTCTSNASGSTGTDQIVGLTIGGTPVPVPTTPNSAVSGLGPLAPLISIEANVQTIKNAPGSTSITNDALVITLLSAANPGETITLGNSECDAQGPDINATTSTSTSTTSPTSTLIPTTTAPTTSTTTAPTVTGGSPNSGPTGGNTGGYSGTGGSSSTGATPTSINGVTAVHTGEPWAGSLPLAAIVFLLGCALFWHRRLASTVGRVTRHMGVIRRGDS